MFQKMFKTMLLVAILAALAFVGYRALNPQQQQTTSETLGNAVDAISDQVTEVGKQIENSEPMEKMEDVVNDVKDQLSDVGAQQPSTDEIQHREGNEANPE